MSASAIVADVRDFLSGLKLEWPDIFPTAEKTAAKPFPVPTGPAPRIPAVAVDAATRPAPEGNFIELFRSRAEVWAPHLGVTFGRVGVRDQRSLWGSCTREGNLSFSWRLTMAPEPVFDYLIVHELAHRAHMNHSRRFWQLVERVCPDHRSHRRWLRKNGAALHAAPRPTRAS